MSRLTPTQEKAIQMARDNGGLLHRIPGGYWVTHQHLDDSDPEEWIPTGTVRALVERGLMQVKATDSYRWKMVELIEGV